jgi:hypothetical protein
MDIRSFVRKAAVWIAAAAGVTSLISEFIKRWADRKGYLDDPTKGWHGLLSLAASVTEFWFFYPALGFFVGLVVGLWFDRLMSSRSRIRSEELVSLGFDMLNFANSLEDRKSRIMYEWPICISDLVPNLQSLLIRIGNLGFSAPALGIAQLRAFPDKVDHILSWPGMQRIPIG